MGKIADELNSRWGVPYDEMEKLGLTDSAEAVLAERARHEVCGYPAVFDDSVHRNGELADAAACYAIAGGGINLEGSHVLNVTITGDCIWPWSQGEWRPAQDPWNDTNAKLHNLQKAGALILAEMDRLHRYRAGSGYAIQD